MHCTSLQHLVVQVLFSSLRQLLKQTDVLQTDVPPVRRSHLTNRRPEMLSVSLRLLCHGGFLYVTVCLSISQHKEREREIPRWMWNNSERGCGEKEGGGKRG